MAVEAQKIRDRIKALFPNASLSQKRMDTIVDRLSKLITDGSDKEAIDTVVNSANSFMSFEDIAKEDDRIRTLEAKTQQKTIDTKPDLVKEVEGMPEWAKVAFDNFSKQNETLVQEITTLKQGEVTKTKKQTAITVFEASEVLNGLQSSTKEKWVNRIDLDSETSVEDQVKGLEDEYNGLIQSYADSKGYAGIPPKGSSNDEATDQEINDIIT